MNPTKAIQRQIEKDNTITIGDGITDCNGRVSEDSIALRELMIYSNLDEEVKEKIQTILLNYGMMFEAEEERLYNCREEIKELLDDSIDKTLWAYEFDLLNIFKPTIKPISVMEKIISTILKKYYQPFIIPINKYDNIVYNKTNTCDKLKHHYKCLKDTSLKWDKYNKYELTVTYKDIKTIILQARDSGGNMDCFGYAHDGTTENCIVAYVGDILNVEYELGYGWKGFKNTTDQQQKELENICEDLWNIVLSYMSDFYVSIY